MYVVHPICQPAANAPQHGNIVGNCVGLSRVNGRTLGRSNPRKFTPFCQRRPQTLFDSAHQRADIVLPCPKISGLKCGRESGQPTFAFDKS